MTYAEAIDFLYNSLPVYHRLGAEAYKPGLDTSRRLDHLFGNPHRRYRTIHIAGTNGKGSTAHSLAAVLQSAGYRTGLYTSPHIFDFRERIRVNGEMIPEQAVTDFVEQWLASPERNELTPSFFELTSTLAFDYFARERVDVAIIETGLGGRLDSTNIISPALSIITNISLDHTNLLGATRPEIAREKAGIIKPDTPVLIGEWDIETGPVFIEAAERAAAEFDFVRPVEAVVEPTRNFYPNTPFGPVSGELRGQCQVRNAATVFDAVEWLRRLDFVIPDAAVADGMANVTGLTHLFGRWTQIGTSPLTIADTGHNCGGWEYIVRELERQPSPVLDLVIGFVADKDTAPIFEKLRPLRQRLRLWFATPSTPRGMDAHTLAAQAAEAGFEGTVIPSATAALAEARTAAGPNGFVLIAGSNFLIADLNPEQTVGA